MISNHIKNVCKIGQGHDCCRYLLAGKDGFECAKMTEGGDVISAQNLLLGQRPYKSVRQLLDDRVAAGDMVARGDNCEGQSQEVLNQNN